jgi:hypothetical protein
MTTDPISPKEIRFIKLGENGRWEKDCIEGSKPCIRLGFDTNHHAESLAGHWKMLTDYWRNVERKTPGKTTELALGFGVNRSSLQNGFRGDRERPHISPLSRKTAERGLV